MQGFFSDVKRLTIFFVWYNISNIRYVDLRVQYGSIHDSKRTILSSKMRLPFPVLLVLCALYKFWSGFWYAAVATIVNRMFAICVNNRLVVGKVFCQKLPCMAPETTFVSSIEGQNPSSTAVFTTNPWNITLLFTSGDPAVLRFWHSSQERHYIAGEVIKRHVRVRNIMRIDSDFPAFEVHLETLGY